MNRLLGSLRLFAAVWVGAASAACASGGSVPGAVDLESATYAAGLGVDVSQMQRTDEGLLILDLEQGTGTRAAPGRTVTLYYSGWLADGTLIDRSARPDSPVSFKVGGGQVVKGWDKGVVGMRVGGRRRIVIPPALGYGARRSGPVPANSILVFDMELASVR